MAALTNYQENLQVDAFFRGGAINSSGTLNSSAVVDGVWAGTTAYTLGQVIVPPSTFTAAAGKLLICTTAGTSGSTTTLAVPAVGSTLADGTVTWTVISVAPCYGTLYVALFVANKGLRANSTAYVVGDVVSLTANGAAGGDTKQHLYRCTTAGTTAASQSGYGGVPGEVVTDGTAVFTEMSPVLQAGTGFPAGFAEVSGGSYARVAYASTLANWAGTQAAGSTTASTGTSGTTSNNAPITFPAPTANWATGTAAVAALMFATTAAGSRYVMAGVLTTPKTVNNGDAAPSFAIAALAPSVDN